MSTRSGTNQFHGNLFMLLRNNVLDARRYNARIADISRQSEYGGSLGGPVRIPKLYDGRNRTFFFANYTGFRRTSEVQGATSTVATAAMRAGDFSANREQIFDPLTADTNGRRQQFPGNIIPANRLASFPRAVNAAVPLPNAPGFAQNYIGANLTGDLSESYFVRGDHHFNTAHRLSASYRTNDRFRRATNGPLPLFDQILDGPLNRNPYLSHDWILSPE
jgi:hypothetical protein